MDSVPVTIRIPKELKKYITEDLRSLEDNDEKIPMNTYILLMIMLGNGVVQRGDEFYRSKNVALDKYIKEQGGKPKKRK